MIFPDPREPPEHRDVARSSAGRRGYRQSPSFFLDGDERILMISSARRGEGKSFVASALAWAVSESVDVERNVLLVDCNLRAPTLHQIWGVANRHGLIDVLNGGVTAANAILLVQGRLFLLPAGGLGGGSFRLLQPERLSTLFTDLSKTFSRILVDTSASLDYPDARRICAVVDGILLVAEAGRTSTSDLTQVRAVLEHAGGHVSGVILNRGSASPSPALASFQYPAEGDWNTDARAADLCDPLPPNASSR